MPRIITVMQGGTAYTRAASRVLIHRRDSRAGQTMSARTHAACTADLTRQNRTTKPKASQGRAFQEFLVDETAFNSRGAQTHSRRLLGLATKKKSVPETRRFVG